jgi:3-demethoxyubiquinol 3-hydroxylase
MDLMRQYSALDRIIIGFDALLKSERPAKGQVSRPNPADSVAATPLMTPDKTLSARLMRVNHAGEVSAQALYQGQGLTARDQQVRHTMQTSAAEEIDHLYWCSQRLHELESYTSYLNPVWYAGSLSLGVMAGLMGDRWSLGFIAETEHQVVNHLDSHLAALPENDDKSRAILLQMRLDEAHHASLAVASGATALPLPVRQLMRICSKLMTKTAYWI